MAILFLVLALALNFIISWANANYVGRYWSESKEVGGSFRAYIVVGYIMAIAGFTMVYGYILLLISPFFLQLANVNQDTILMFEFLGREDFVQRFDCRLELLCSNSQYCECSTKCTKCYKWSCRNSFWWQREEKRQYYNCSISNFCLNTCYLWWIFHCICNYEKSRS